MTDEQKELWLEGAETFGDAVENRRIVPVMEEGEIDFTVSMPAVKYDKDPSIHTSAKPEGYRQVYWKTFWNKIMEGYNMAVDATSDLTDLKTIIEQAIEEAEAAAQAATEAVEAAENVNADLTGMTVTITDREGQSKSVNIGFEISEDHVYLSKAAMKADAANVSKGQFCMIANNNPDDEDNATLWSRNAYSASDPEHFPYSFLSDLDQASSAAWADWLENMKPAIILATSDANTAATLADTKAALAQTAADNADASRLAIEANEQTRQTNEADRVAAETQRATDWNNFFSDTIATGCRKLWNDFWSNINSLWTGFWGTSADDPNGVRKQWSDLHDAATADHVQAGNDHTRANQDHSIAENDHSRAEIDHSTAGDDHTRAGQDHIASEQATAEAIEQAELLEEWNEHQPYIGDGTTGDENFWYIWVDGQYVKSVYAKGDDLHWEEMSEQEKQDLASRVLAQLVFATPEETRAMLNELT